jgi:tetratricopeptide (TPR) repeat protein
MKRRPTEPDPLQVALHEASLLLTTQPARAAQRAQEILQSLPGNAQAALILGVARRIGGNVDGALQVLRPLARSQPGWSPPAYEIGVTLGMAGRRLEAVDWLHRAVRLKPDVGDAWQLIAEHLMALGDPSSADAAFQGHLVAISRDPRLSEPAMALLNGRLDEAEALLRTHLTKHPTDVVALRLQARIAMRVERSLLAEPLLARCLELAPGFAAARYDYARVLQRLNRLTEALSEVERLLAQEPQHPGCRTLQAELFTATGRHAEAAEIHAGLTRDYPGNAGHWIRLGYALRMVEREDDAIAAFRHAMQLAPYRGEPYWALVSNGRFQFSADQRAAMQHQAARADLPADDRVHLRFALGKAFEDSGEYAESFRHYAEGNRLHRAAHPYRPERTTELVRRSIETFSGEFLVGRAGQGCPAVDPIFIIGMPHSGSRLVERILASHSAVEATAERPHIVALAWSLTVSRKDASIRSYPELLGTLSPDELMQLGESYLREMQGQRRTDASRFIDGFVNNWEHVGLIHLMLPNAKIIDVRRDAMGSCFSCFKHHFASRQDFAYDLRDLGRYCRDYVDLMTRFDDVLPGRIYRVDYRALVQDTEAEVRRLLEHCGLPFDPACLRCDENERAVGTPDAGQVRLPVYRDALDHWRRYEPWLGPLKEALGPLAG